MNKLLQRKPCMQLISKFSSRLWIQNLFILTSQLVNTTEGRWKEGSSILEFEHISREFWCSKAGVWAATPWWRHRRQYENRKLHEVQHRRQQTDPILFCLWASPGHSFTDSELVCQQHFPGGVISGNTVTFKPLMKNHLVLGGSKLPVWGSPCSSPEPNIEQIPPKFHCLMTFSSLNGAALFFHPLNGFHRHMQNAKDGPRNRPVEKMRRAKELGPCWLREATCKYLAPAWIRMSPPLPLKLLWPGLPVLPSMLLAFKKKIIITRLSYWHHKPC